MEVSGHIQVPAALNPEKNPLRINLLKTKRNLLYVMNQSVPRCKNFPPRL
jgi:hypothetical protein